MYNSSSFYLLFHSFVTLLFHLQSKSSSSPCHTHTHVSISIQILPLRDRQVFFVFTVQSVPGFKLQPLPWPVWLTWWASSNRQKFASSVPVWPHAWAVVWFSWLVCWSGHIWEATLQCFSRTHIGVSLSLFLPMFLLSKNKYINYCKKLQPSNKNKNVIFSINKNKLDSKRAKNIQVGVSFK